MSYIWQNKIFKILVSQDIDSFLETEYYIVTRRDARQNKRSLFDFNLDLEAAKWPYPAKPFLTA